MHADWVNCPGDIVSGSCNGAQQLQFPKYGEKSVTERQHQYPHNVDAVSFSTHPAAVFDPRSYAQ